MDRGHTNGGVRRWLLEDRSAQIAEIAIVFGAAALILIVFLPLVGENALAGQIVIWFANVTMLGLIWLGLRLRRQSWEDLGVGFGFSGWRAVLRVVARSLAVFAFAVIAFLVPTIVLGAILGRPEQADMSGYDYLSGNLPLLLAALAGVYVVSSFGEEVIYRGFLIRRLADSGSATRTAWGIAVGASAVVFGLIHFAWGPVGVVQTTSMGLALGLAFLFLGRRLWPLILAHAYMDTLLIVQMYFV